MEILPPEAFNIANYIKSKPNEYQDIYIQKLKEHREYAKGKTFEAYNKPCPFLTSSRSCAIYNVRPHKCRAYLSKSLTVCQTGRDAEQDEQLSSATSQLANDSIHIYKSKKLIMHPTELGQGVLSALENDLEDEWAKGVQIFELLPEKILL
ncbi:MAG: Fe-S-cluster containining protein [Psychroserpens sp.]